MSKQLPDELRHALRAVLRGASYLPDSVARTYFRTYAVYRFRSVADKIRFSDVQQAEKLVAKYHHHKRIAKVWQAAHQLERAGHGSEPDLQKALYMTYGRRGKRRRELLQELVQPGEEMYPDDEAALQKLIDKSKEEGKVENKKLRAFINSHKAHHPLDSPRPKIRHLQPQIPKENIWSRPTPLKRRANIKKAFWADLMDRLMPPVSRHEWNRLRDLATGAIETEGLIPRRTRVGGIEPSDQKLWEYLSLPANRQKIKLDKISITSEVTTQWAGRAPAFQPGLRTLTSRYMRRFYATIWGMTATMSQDETSKEWTTKWGGSRSAAHSGRVTAPSMADLELFEGADESVATGPLEVKKKQKRRNKRLAARTEARLSVALEEGYTSGVIPVI